MYFNQEYLAVVGDLQSDIETGLTTKVAKERLEKGGYNLLESKKNKSLFLKFVDQFKNTLTIVLIIATILSFVFTRELIDSLIILTVILLNAVLGVVQESKAERSLEALKKLTALNTKVIRDNKLTVIDSKDLVKGDIVVLEAGDIVSADLRIINANNLQVDESSLTGESVPVEKNNLIINHNDIPISEKKNLLFSSTFITNGKVKGVVVATGMETEVGKIANLLLTTKERLTPLQIKLNSIGRSIGYICISICLVVFVLQLIIGSSWISSLQIAIALAVAAVPEGLVSVVTIVLAIGVDKMAKENAIVKKLPAVETLGSASVICTDKTGTLTENKMTVVEGYVNETFDLNDLLSNEQKRLLDYFALCTNAEINIIGEKEQRIGDPTETALIEASNKFGSQINIKEKYERLFELPFDSDRQMMSVVIKIEDKNLVITKGSPEAIFNCSSNQVEIDKARQVNIKMANRALRVLALSVKEISSNELIKENIENNLTFMGLIGLIDPARVEVKSLIEEALKASIRTIMITGDQINTAIAIGKDLKILTKDEEAINAEDLNKLTDEELDKVITKYFVYARVSPSDKVRIVKAWQKQNAVVAMTGDGVNDSPALKQADIGCAMGITGTDVAKEAAALILVDDNYATIIKAVKQGRGIYENIKKSVKYLLSSNIGEVLAIFLSTLLTALGVINIGVPLLAIHLLWINLITDSLPAFALGVEKVHGSIMENKPRPKNENFFAHNFGLEIIVEGIIIGLITLVSYIIGYILSKDIKISQTMAFITLSTIQLLQAYNIKSKYSIFSRNAFDNKYLNWAFLVGFTLQMLICYLPSLSKLFKLKSLSFNYLIISLLLAILMVVIIEIKKLYVNLKTKKSESI